MCGIIAISDLSGNARESLSSAMSSMIHRGPDASSVWCDSVQSIALGHCRLEVRGSGNYEQPVRNETGDIVITVNGELYDYSLNRRWLEGRGHVFSTESDSEIALHLYEEFGSSFVSKLRGEFSLVLWDGRTQRLVAARDRFGIKPLVYSSGACATVIASEAKAIFATGLVQPQWDVDSVKHSLAHQYLPPTKTMFHGVRSIPPAHILVIDGINSEPELSPYWKPSFTEEDVAPEAIFEALNDAIGVRLESKDPPAFSLSGGLDSSAIVAMASRRLGRAVPAFTVSFSDSEVYDELGLVSSSANDLGADLNIVPVSRVDMITELSDAVYQSEGLAINGQLVAKYMLNRSIRESGHNVVLTGEGADEVFLGYAHLQIDSGGLEGLSSFSRQKGIMLPESLDTDRMPPQWLEHWPTFLLAKMSFADHFSGLLNEGFQFSSEAYVNQWLEQLYATGEFEQAMSFVRKSSWVWTRSALSGYILRTLADGTEMAHSVEGRLPFLDQKLFDLASRVSSAANLKNGDSKVLLRQSLYSILPESIRMRGKHPFLAPPLLSDGCPSIAIDYISDTIRSDSFASIPFFNKRQVIKWFDDLIHSNSDRKNQSDPAIMTLLSFAAMHHRYCL